MFDFQWCATIRGGANRYNCLVLQLYKNKLSYKYSCDQSDFYLQQVRKCSISYSAAVHLYKSIYIKLLVRAGQHIKNVRGNIVVREAAKKDVRALSRLIPNNNYRPFFSSIGLEYDIENDAALGWNVVLEAVQFRLENPDPMQHSKLYLLRTCFLALSFTNRTHDAQDRRRTERG